MCDDDDDEDMLLNVYTLVYIYRIYINIALTFDLWGGCGENAIGPTNRSTRGSTTYVFFFCILCKCVNNDFHTRDFTFD